MSTSGVRPDWNKLAELASRQAGYFTYADASAAGYSRDLLKYHVRQGHADRASRGIFRLPHYPSSEHDDLVVAWLWSEKEGVFSHETALMLHELSDVMPARIHLTLPTKWDHRLKPPGPVSLHYADLAPKDIAWAGVVKVTTPLRTLVDSVRDNLPPDIVRQARAQAIRRGLVRRDELKAAR